MNTTNLGNLAEEQAARYLTQKGYHILARNFRVNGGEIDIIAKQRNTLVIVEVKQRASCAFGGPLAAITAAKQQRITRTTAQFIKINKGLRYDAIRFDVICILAGKIEHIEHAFTSSRLTL
jgi:putative endonuclease